MALVATFLVVSGTYLVLAVAEPALRVSDDRESSPGTSGRKRLLVALAPITAPVLCVGAVVLKWWSREHFELSARSLGAIQIWLLGSLIILGAVGILFFMGAFIASSCRRSPWTPMFLSLLGMAINYMGIVALALIL